MNNLRDKARRAFYAIKFDIQIRIWLKILESVIESIGLHGCEVWGPLRVTAQSHITASGLRPNGNLFSIYRE